MTKVSITVLLLAAFAAEALCDLPVVYPTYQTTREVPKTRSAREAAVELDDYNFEYHHDVPVCEEVRVPRSVDSPSAKRGGGSHTTSSGSRDTGPTHPGYNRRNTRSIHDEPLLHYKGDDVIKAPSTGEHPHLPTYIDDVRMDPNRRYARSPSDDLFRHRPCDPDPLLPRPIFSKPIADLLFYPEPKVPLYGRSKRDYQVPKFNPNVPSGPWQKLPMGGTFH